MLQLFHFNGINNYVKVTRLAADWKLKNLFRKYILPFIVNNF